MCFIDAGFRFVFTKYSGLWRYLKRYKESREVYMITKKISFIILMVMLAIGLTSAMCMAGELRETVKTGEYRLIESDQDFSIKMNGYGSLACPGKPELPARRFLLALPPGTRADCVTLLHARTTVLNPQGIPRKSAPVRMLAPLSYGPEKHAELNAEFTCNAESVYGGTQLYPDQVVALISTGTYRQISYACIEIRPIQYNPVTGELICSNDIEYSVNFSNLETRPNQNSPDWETITRAKDLFVNFEAMEPLYSAADVMGGTPGETFDYLILTAPNLVASIESSTFPTWKQNLNYSLKIVTIDDPEITSQPGRDLAEKIRNYLRANYLVWNTRYLLIVGNTATIPMRYCYPNPNDHSNQAGHPDIIGGDVPTDYFYADLSFPEAESWDSDGDGFAGEYGEDEPDFVADIFVGRIPTNLKSRITYTLDKLVAFEQDTGTWKNSALHGGAFWYVTNENGSGYPAYDGATCMNEMEQNLMNGWNISHYSEQEGLERSVFEWPAMSFEVFTEDWRTGSYGIINWGAHGFSNRAAQKIWAWDDGDGVPDSNEFLWPEFISLSADLDDDYLCYVFAISCLIGCPEPNNWGNIGIDFLTKPGWGPCAAVLGATRIAYGRSGWPENLGGSESTCYEFNRHVIDGPDGPEKAGDALYNAKLTCHLTCPVDHFSENWTQFNYNLYGDPTLVRLGISETPTPRPTATPTPVCTEFSVELGMPSDMFAPGDICSCWVELCNPDAGVRNDLTLYVILDVWGALFFAPGFGDFDFYEISLMPGSVRMDVLPEFLWPQGSGSADGLKWYAGMTESGTANLVGEIDIWDFGFYE